MSTTMGVTKGQAVRHRTRDLRGAVLALGFVLLLLASEAGLDLPDDTDQPGAVAAFHRMTIHYPDAACPDRAGTVACRGLRQ